jgi:N-acetylmuramoyl-L-alanine amidase
MIERRHLTVNPYSRPGRRLHTVRAIVLHWVANPGSSAGANRDYWEDRKDGRNGYGSAHYVIDDRTVIEAIPPDEMAYHVGARSYTRFGQRISSYPNDATIGVELCHEDWTGALSPTVWDRAVELVGDLCMSYGLPPYAITTHYAITGKLCPRWFVDHADDLDLIRWDVSDYIKGKV